MFPEVSVLWDCLSLTGEENGLAMSVGPLRPSYEANIDKIEGEKQSCNNS